MTLCDLCTGLSPRAKLYKHYPSWGKLETSAKACEVCQLLSTLLEKNGHRKSAEEYRADIDGSRRLINDTSITISANNHQPWKAEDATTPVYQLVVSCGPIMRQGASGAFKQVDDVRAPVQVLGIYAEEGSEAALVIAPRPTTDRSDSDRSFQLMSDWISECAKDHSDCQIGFMDGKNRVRAPNITEMTEKLKLLSAEEDTPLPTRILDIGDGVEQDRICLLSTGRVKGTYAALSHCWGKSRQLVTTKATLEERLANIDFNDLSKTFQDAVVITRRLGIRYLWIDSLCILQDDVNDWEHESAMMGEVYRNAYFTIAAAASSSGEGGCFRSRFPSPTNAIRLNFLSEEGKSAGNWYVHEQSGDYSRSVRNAPLQQRGWVLQERYLSRRILHFAEDQIYFECNRSLRYEDCRPENEHNFGYLSFSTLYFTAANPSPPYQLLLHGLLRAQWIKVVEAATRRELTKEEDALPAISGIATHLSSITKIGYAAGMWTGITFEDQLLWRVQEYKKGERNSRPESYRAPSWSWASMKGPVLFPSFGAEPLEPGHTIGMVTPGDIQVSVQPAGYDPNGRLLSGTVDLRGWLVPVRRLEQGGFEQEDWSRFVECYKRLEFFGPPRRSLMRYSFARSLDTTTFWGYAAFDDKGEGIGDVSALLVKKQDVKDEEAKEFAKCEHIASFFVLFLAPTGSKDGEYKRVGMGHLVQFEKADFGRKKQISII